jgi:hypothetical protein
VHLSLSPLAKSSRSLPITLHRFRALPGILLTLQLLLQRRCLRLLSPGPVHLVPARSARSSPRWHFQPLHSSLDFNFILLNHTHVLSIA